MFSGGGRVPEQEGHGEEKASAASEVEVGSRSAHVPRFTTD